MGQGFMFTEEEMRVSPSVDPSASCHKCGLFRTCKTPYMKPYGKGRKKILIISDSPGRLEDNEGIPLVGEYGTFLSRALGRMGISMDLDCWRTDAIICRPPNNRNPKNEELRNCRKMLYKTIEQLKPEKILTFGKFALQGLLGHRVSVTDLSRFVGFSIPDQELGITVYPNHHPSYILQMNENRAASLWFNAYLQRAIEDGPFFKHDYMNRYEILNDSRRIKNLLEALVHQGKPVAFDYETTGIKPFNEGHEVVYASVSDGEGSYAFEITEQVRGAWISFLKSDVPKVAHNLKFEEEWSRTIFGQPVQAWLWDTMIAAHILDNRPKITGLKHQTYINFGVYGYEEGVTGYLRATKEQEDQFGANAKNKIRMASPDEIMQYCALDSLFTIKLYYKQEPIVNAQYSDAFAFFMQSLDTMVELEINGIHADRDYYVRTQNQLRFDLDELRKEILTYPKVPSGFNPSSPMQIQEVLYDVMGVKCTKETKSGGRSTDSEALEMTKNPWAHKLVQYRKLDKLYGTYVSGFLREISDDGKLHCNFNLNTVSTFRSSSSSPNFQNIPKRDKAAMNMTRGGLRAAPGHFLAELDFKGVEVSISACYHKDRNMIRYIEDETTDMHRDMAARLFIKDKADITKMERFAAKNGMVFAQFYGDYYGNCGPNIWKILVESSPETIEHLKKHKIRNVNQFTNHVQTVEEWMWGEMFPQYARWKEDNWRKYQRNGYVEYFTGFRTQGIMDKNVVNNCAIQGTAFHVLLWTLNYVAGRLHRLESYPMGQIHDSMILSIAPGEEEVVLAIVKKALEEIKGLWDWIIVPLTIEYERTQVGEDWTKLEEAGKITA